MQHRTRTFAGHALLLAALAAFGAQAQTTQPKLAATPPEAAAAVFKRLDTNQDGRLSRDEVATLPAVAERFDQLDQNKDGLLSAEEFAAGYVASKP